MDRFQKNMINAMVESNRTVFYFDIVGEINDVDYFKKQFNTDNFFILKISKIEEIVLYLNKLFSEVEKNDAFDEFGIIVNDIRHFGTEYQHQNMFDKMLEMYMANYTKMFLSLMRDFAIKGTIVYMVGKTNQQDEI